MTITLEELKQRLKNEPELTLLEVLNISSEELVERFEDIIEEKQDRLKYDLEYEEDEEAD